MQVITVDGHRLCVEALNPGAAGDPLVLLHGVVSANSFWGDDQTAVLRAHGPCFVVSLPGHAPSSFPPGFRAEQLSAELRSASTRSARPSSSPRRPRHAAEARWSCSIRPSG
jgi:pimeloyl-ACP methyl ester carboxylesterase